MFSHAIHQNEFNDLVLRSNERADHVKSVQSELEIVKDSVTKANATISELKVNTDAQMFLI